jgi:hypothetical protein
MNLNKPPKNGEKSLLALKKNALNVRHLYEYKYHTLQRFAESSGVKNYRIKEYLDKYKRVIKTMDEIIDL